eukprot:5598246-Amphidinium_carterae.1
MMSGFHRTVSLPRHVLDPPACLLDAENDVEVVLVIIFGPQEPCRIQLPTVMVKPSPLVFAHTKFEATFNAAEPRMPF